MKRLFSVVLALLLAVQLPARVKLPAVLGSNMVLQRNTEVNFWGEASPRSRVRVTASWDGRTHETRADASGRWALKLPTGEAGGPYTVTLSDGEPLVLDNVLVGEVWVCSGQSNMEMPVSGFMFQPVEGAVDAIADAGMYPGIRMFTVPRVSSKTIAMRPGRPRRPPPSASSAPLAISSGVCSTRHWAFRSGSSLPTGAVRPSRRG